MNMKKSCMSAIIYTLHYPSHHMKEDEMAGHAARTEKMWNEYKTLHEKPDERKPHVCKSRCRREYNTKMDPKDIGYETVGFIQLRIGSSGRRIISWSADKLPAFQEGRYSMSLSITWASHPLLCQDIARWSTRFVHGKTRRCINCSTKWDGTS